MKFYNYLNELYADYNTINIIEYLKKCKPFINDWKKAKSENFLYSGRKLSAKYIIKKVRQDRKSLDTPINLHRLVDDEFEKLFDIKARSQTLFCTPNMAMARRYGVPYYIFPVGKYEIIWSDSVGDLYSSLIDVSYNEKLAVDLVNTAYKKGDLKNALKSGNEIMVYCKEYLAIKLDFIPYSTLSNLVKEM